MRSQSHHSITILRTLSVFMAWVLCVNSIQAARLSESGAAGLSQAPAAQGPTIREQALLIPAGSTVEVRLTNKERLKGRIGNVSEDGVVIKYTKTNKIEERQIAFGEMKSIKVLGGGSAALRTVGWGLAGVGIFLTVYVIYALFHH